MFDNFSLRFRKPVVADAVAAHAALAARRGMSSVQLALGCVRSCRYPGAAIVAATTIAQLA